MSATVESNPTAEAPPPSRELRGATNLLYASGDHYAAFRAAHDRGLLDPEDGDLREARGKLDPDSDLDALRAQAVDDADAYEQDLVRALDSSPKGRTALLRGALPTGVAAVDDEISHVRRARARLEVVDEWQRTGAPSLPKDETSAKPKRRRSRKQQEAAG